MNDPKATKMTLEEAVRIERFARGEWKARMPFTLDQWLYARAIVDQAVRFVKAREQEWDGLTPQPGAIDEFYNLRAMQRGEAQS